tara:strand:- start:1270 stop:2049 length:780 start_codon:yes stop_codon:yes gene_type:complete
VTNLLKLLIIDLKGMMNKLHKIFNQKGYFIQKNVFSEEFINSLINEINKIENANFYYDSYKKLRRIEKLYDKGKYLKDLNNLILSKLLDIFNKEFLIFKDKFNAKPPGGKGFFPHFDGIFEFQDENNKIRKGWYEYGNFFVNVLVALDDCTEENGTIEIANRFDKNDFAYLIDFTKKNGTPELNSISVKKCSFEKIVLKKGDVVFFSNICPHKSEKNTSNNNRRTLYYTYLSKDFGYQYEKYFHDKELSRNKTSKSLDD